MSPYLDDGDVVLHLGDCVEVMAAMAPESVDAVVCDPPYGLEFMGKEWDRLWDARGRQPGDPANRSQTASPHRGSDAPTFVAGLPAQEWHQTWATEALRVLKPGGHLLAFGGTRTFHRLTCAIEDAGFEVRDCLSWLYGSGFPKSLDVSKAIDKAAGAEREVVGRYQPPNGKAWNLRNDEATPGSDGQTMGAFDRRSEAMDLTAPATPEAAAWQGWGTALKPAWEPIVVARKPLAGTVAQNCLAHGTGAINVDGCRVGGGGPKGEGGRLRGATGGVSAFNGGNHNPVDDAAGRWPANVVLSHTPECREVGTRKVRPVGESAGNAYKGGPTDGVTGFGTGSGGGKRGHVSPDGTETVAAWECHPECPVRRLDEDTEGARASRPSATGTGWGPTGAFPIENGTPVAHDGAGASRFFYTAKASSAERDGASHPTVKPLALMRWLVRLVTPPGGLVLDPFAGSGTTGLACREEGFRCVLIEREEEYAAMAAHRLRQLSLLGGAA